MNFSSIQVGDLVYIQCGSALGQLNPIALREDGWKPGMAVTVEEILHNAKVIKVKLPKGERFLQENDVVKTVRR